MKILGIATPVCELVRNDMNILPWVNAHGSFLLRYCNLTFIGCCDNIKIENSSARLPGRVSRPPKYTCFAARTALEGVASCGFLSLSERYIVLRVG